MSILNNSLLLGADAGGYQISRSLRFNSADSAYLSRTPASAGNRKTWTWSGWVKRGVLGSSFQTIFGAGTGGNAEASIRFNSDDTLEFYAWTGSYNARLLTTQVFRDVSAWYHLVAVFDTPNTTADQRIRLYVNGIEITTFSSRTNPTQNYDGYFNNSISHTIGDAVSGASPRFFNGYLADIHFIDGQALTPSSFAETNATTGQWVPKAYTGSYGNGFRLDFSDNSAATATTLGKDRAGSNNWTPNNLSVTAGAGNDSLVDTPTSYGTGNSGGDVRGNYATLNPLRTGGGTLSNGNLDSSLAVSQRAQSTISVNTGKWYCEFTLTAVPALVHCGLVSEDNYIATYLSDGQKSIDNSTSAYGSSYTSGDVVGCAIDIDAKSATFYKNGASQGSFNWSGSYSIHTFAFESRGATAGTRTATANFGQRPFAYTAPSGFKALCDTSLPAPTIARPSTVMDVKLYTGNGTTNNITGLGFSPDLVWIKSRSDAFGHRLFDTVRPLNGALYTNTTEAERTVTTNDNFTAFNLGGFSLGATSSTNGSNASGSTFAAWTWNAGSSTVTNTSGSISSQVRANASAGFSVVTWTGQTAAGSIGHGLNAAPSLIICKARSNAQSWGVYHKDVGINSYLLLDSTGASTAYAGIWGSSAPTSTVFGVPGNVGLNNNNGWTYVAYCFAPVAGYSAFGSYTGNGSADGPFVYTGFRPRWILVKRTDGVIQWTILDTARSPKNVADERLFPNLSQAETVNGDGNTDLLSNGFKPRNIDSAFNANGGAYIYAAFAESPLQHSRAR